MVLLFLVKTSVIRCIQKSAEAIYMSEGSWWQKMGVSTLVGMLQNSEFLMAKVVILPGLAHTQDLILIVQTLF